MRLFCLMATFVLTAYSAIATAEERVWTSKNGNFTLKADAIAFSDSLVVLKRPDGKLVAVELNQLSDADLEFVKSKETQDSASRSADEMQTWTAQDGLKFRGRVTAYGRKEVVVQRLRGKVMIGEEPFTKLDPLHQKVTLKVLSKLENKQLDDAAALETWVKKNLGGQPKQYLLEGVMLELENGDEIGVPFFMFSPDDLKVLEPGWELWVEQNDSEQLREQESFLMRSAAMAYQQDRAAQRQIELMKLDLLAAASGVIAIWEVGLIPGPNVRGRPMSVMVPAQNSQIATRQALARYPGYGLVGVRRASN